jgi:two-component system, NtrC family, response regulator HydG
MSLRILIAEDEDITRKHLLHALTKEGYEAVGTGNGLEALGRMEKEYFDVLITDIRMPGMSGIELLERVKERFPGIEVLIITGFGSIDSAVEAMKKGAHEYITKPFNLDELLMKVKNLHERKILKRENLALKTFFGMEKGISIIARSEVMRDIMEEVGRIRDSDSCVLVTGENGAGKSLVAKMVHFTSRRQHMPFLSVNCATLTDRLLDEELFGHEHALTGGSAGVRRGFVEIADTGTLFLNEITGMPPHIQNKLLKVIEDGEFYRLGGKTPVKVNVRFIAASNRNVLPLIKEGRFIEELHYRLNVIEIFVPPLREHMKDLEPLCDFFLKKHIGSMNKKIEGFSEDAMEILKGYSFPGNVRELENIVERAVILEKGTMISAGSLPRSIKMFRIETFQPDRIQTMGELTREYAEKILDLAGGDKLKAALLLGISELDLWKILKEK